MALTIALPPDSLSREQSLASPTSQCLTPRQRFRLCSITDRVEMMLQDDSTERHPERGVHPAQKSLHAGWQASISGAQPAEKDLFVPYFSPKDFVFDWEESSKLPHDIGLRSQRGSKHDSPNQDDFVVLMQDDWLLCGVFDGHGPHGHAISYLTQQRLPERLLEDVNKRASFGIDWSKVASSAFSEATKCLATELPEETLRSGTTASIAFLSHEESGMRLRCAFVGDSQIVHAQRFKGAKTWDIQELGAPHKPDREDEAARIIAAGGKVLHSDTPGLPARLASEFGDLAMSRSLGDFDRVAVGLTSQPEVTPELFLETDKDHIILIASDGIWDMITPRQAVQLVAKHREDEVQTAVEKLVAKAQHRWRESGDDVDDISVILVRPNMGKVAGDR